MRNKINKIIGALPEEQETNRKFIQLIRLAGEQELTGKGWKDGWKQEIGRWTGMLHLPPF